MRLTQGCCGHRGKPAGQVPVLHARGAASKAPEGMEVDEGMNAVAVDNLVVDKKWREQVDEWSEGDIPMRDIAWAAQNIEGRFVDAWPYFLHAALESLVVLAELSRVRRTALRAAWDRTVLGRLAACGSH